MEIYFKWTLSYLAPSFIRHEDRFAIVSGAALVPDLSNE